MSSADDTAATSQDEGMASGNQSAINAYDRMLHDKERAIRENIARKVSRIHQVERQLESVRVALHVNVGPRRQALEHLRSKIEAQNHKVDEHRTEYRKHKELADQALEAMQREEALKNRMAVELNTLVQESATAQLRKLEELSEELEHLTTGLPPELGANGSSSSAGAAAAPAPAAAAPQGGANGDGAVPAAAAPGAAEQQQGGVAGAAPGQQAAAGGAGAQGHAIPPEDAAAAAEAEQQRREQQQQAQEAERQRRQAAAARGRHVQLGGKKATATRIPQPQSPANGAVAGRSGSSGPFQGFE